MLRALGATTDGGSFTDVHVGLGGRPIPERTLRRILTLSFLVEDTLFDLSPRPLRSTGDDAARPASLALESRLGLADAEELRRYNTLNRASFCLNGGPGNLSAGFGDWRPMFDRLHQQIVYLWTREGDVLLDSVYGEEWHERRYTIQPSSPGGGTEGDVTAVAFRMQLSSLGEEEEPGLWADLCFAFFNTCRAAEEAEFRWLVDQVMAARVKGHYGAVELLEHLGQMGSQEEWREKVEAWGEELVARRPERVKVKKAGQGKKKADGDISAPKG